MSNTVNSSTRWNPNAIRRCVRVTDVANDGIIGFTTKSFTTVDGEHHVHVDSITGAVICSCPDFTYRKAKNHPHVHSPEDALCKHAIRAVANLRRKGFDL